MDLKSHIRTVMDFPKKGINFFDITTLLKDKNAFSYSVDAFYKKYKGKNAEGQRRKI